MADYSAGNLEVSLLTTADEVSRVFSALNKQLSTTQKLVVAITGRNSKVSNALETSKSGGAFSFLNMAKWGTTIFMARRLGRVVANIAQSGADYTETLNLWETSMGTNINLATEFVNKMNEAYGISEKTLMNAQATFKNMLGGLGNISQEMAYALSEGVTQMAVDYASLYNVTFEQAFTKFQAALAGQVRPIRSVSGFDITENTIFQLYQQLGGEKTMRQLNRTEKQLLSLLAIFQQMNATGAIGDLNKTMGSFANQSRVMAESWQQVLSYSGILLTHMIEQSGLLTYVNATLIFIGDVLKAVAESVGAIKHFADPFQSVTEGALGAVKATEELNGKLLDIDKFRALNESSDTNAFGLDERLIEAFKNFDSILENADMEARELAESWKVLSGLFDEDGEFNKERWNEFSENLKTTATLLAGILALKFFSNMTQGAIGFFKVAKKGLPILIADFKKINDPLRMSSATIFLLVAGIGSFVKAWDNMSGVQRAIGILATLATTLTAVAIAFHATHNWAKALMVGGMVAGGTLLAYSQLTKITDFKNGGLPDKGTVFRAGEAGAEIVYNTPSGQSGVANVQQIAQATYNGTIKALNDWWGGSRAKGDIPQLERANPTGMYQAVTGVARANGNDWNKII